MHCEPGTVQCSAVQWSEVSVPAYGSAITRVSSPVGICDVSELVCLLLRSLQQLPSIPCVYGQVCQVQEQWRPEGRGVVSLDDTHRLVGEDIRRVASGQLPRRAQIPSQVETIVFSVRILKHSTATPNPDVWYSRRKCNKWKMLLTAEWHLGRQASHLSVQTKLDRFSKSALLLRSKTSYNFWVFYRWINILSLYSFLIKVLQSYFVTSFHRNFV